MRDPRGRSVYDDVPINGEESEFRSFDDDEGGEDLTANGFDYENQAWVVDGRYVSCGHPDSMDCGCFGRIHVGESPAANAEIH